MTGGQEAVWWVDCLQGGQSIQYNVAYAIYFAEKVDQSALKRSLNLILQRHPVLRTVFRNSEGYKPVADILPEKVIDLKCEFIYLHEFEAIAQAEARTPFHLSSAPPLRIRLFEVTDTQKNILLVNHHHIIHDEISIEIFINDLFSTYENESILSFGTNHTLNQTSESLSYWCDKLKNYRPLLLPFRKESGILVPTAGDSHHFSIERELIQKMKEICSQNNCSMYMGLLTALTLLLSKYSSMDDISFGTAMSTRTFQGDENQIGMFVNIVILRNEVMGSDTFHTLLSKVRNTVIDAVVHRFTTLNSITRSVKLNRLPGESRLFDLFVGYHRMNDFLSRIESGPLAGEIKFIDNKTAKYGITIDFYDDGESVSGRIEYCTELFEIESIRNLAQDLSEIIEKAV
jgi:hypothetical protein